jgi:hypothetical protein
MVFSQHFHRGTKENDEKYRDERSSDGESCSKPPEYEVEVLIAHTVTFVIYEGVSRSFRTGCLERELQMVQLSATRRSCIAIL